MNRRLLAAACFLALSSLALAQATAVPDTISYQGRVTDSSGNLVGAGSAVNRTAWFRIYDSATGGTRLWSEQQTITIANGDFSVLLGTGTAITGETNANPLNAIFTGATRFLGVTIDDGTSAVDTEISPRQQLVTTPFAFRAKVAEAVLSQAITTTMIANNAVTGTQIADATIAAAKLAAGSVDGTKIVDGSISTIDLANASVTAAKLGSDVGVWTPSGNNVLRTVGNVGIGTATPMVSLSLGGVTANSKLAVWDNGVGGLMGFGVQGSQFRMHVNQATDRFSFLDSSAGNEIATLTGTGRLGIGTSTPTAKLSVGSDLANTKVAVWDNGGANLYGFGIQSGQFRFHVDTSAAKFSFLNGPAGSEIMTLTGTGNLGIGHTAPPYPLSVYKSDVARAVFVNDTTGTGATDGLHVGSDAASAFIWNWEPTVLHFATSATERVRIEADGRMGFNMANGDGNMAFVMKSLASYYVLTIQDRTGAWAFSFTEDGTAYKKGATNWTSLSDRRLKKDIADLTGSLDRLLKLQTVTFDFKDPSNGKGRQTGFIAQQVQEVFPEWVKKLPNDYLGVGPQGFEAHTVQALRELRAEKDAQNEKLAARIKELEAQNAALATQVKDLTAQNAVAGSRLDALEHKINAFARTMVTADSK